MKSTIKILAFLTCSIFFSFDAQSQVSVHSGGALTHHANSYVNIKGDLAISGSNDHNASSNEMFSGTVKQTITVTGNDTVTFGNVTLNNSFGEIDLDGIFAVSNQLLFNDGILLMKTGASNTNTSVVFKDGSTVGTGADAPDNDSYVEVPVKKIGDEAFTFPVGNANLYRPIMISAPLSVTDEFQIQYFRTDPTSDGYDITLKESSIDNVSSLGYYDVDRTAGTSDVKLSLYYDNLEWDPFDDVCNLVVSHWDGAEWENLGNGGTTGSSSGFLTNGDGSGTCGSSQDVTSFSPFALASVSSGTILPVELLNFTAVPVENEVHLSWSTATEINNDYFVLEHSRDAITWDFLDQVQGQGNSTSLTNYNSIDDRPFLGENYYRLKQVDFDGSIEYSDVRIVEFNGTSDGDIILYPNPSNKVITIESSTDELDLLSVSDAFGKNITSELSIIERGEHHIVLNIQELEAGFYFVKTPNNELLRFVKINK